jgi:hypothetical protein
MIWLFQPRCSLGQTSLENGESCRVHRATHTERNPGTFSRFVGQSAVARGSGSWLSSDAHSLGKKLDVLNVILSFKLLTIACVRISLPFCRSETYEVIFVRVDSCFMMFPKQFGIEKLNKELLARVTLSPLYLLIQNCILPIHIPIY